MKFKSLFQYNSLGALLASLGIIVGVILFMAVIYFYIYLPSITNHGESITVPNLEGMQTEQLEEFLTKHDLRYTVDDSAYSEKYPPLSVLRQFPRAGAKVKENRMIYISVNRVTPPTLPIPDLVDRSLINAEVVLKSNELKRGRLLFEASPFLNLVKEMRYQGKPIKAGTRLPKGAIIDLVVGDGNGPADFTIGNLVGDSYERALFKLMGWNLHLGKVQIPPGVDTTGVEPFVYKQEPAKGDSVRVGDPIDIWVAPKGFKEPEEEEVDNNR